ncbi:MAG: flavodoxin family protein [Actinomycetota bacterium]|nr:flavodoxin family protein [Actinomycetota bacterium]
MRIVAFIGSPRKGGNSRTLLDEALKGARQAGAELKIFDLPGMKIEGCRNCGCCADTGNCVIKDDMQMIYPELRACQGVILAAPVYFSGLPSQTKAMIDRCQSIWCEKYLLKKPIPGENRAGLFITVAGMDKKEGEKCSGATARAFFLTVSLTDMKKLAYVGIDAKGDVLKHPEALKEVFEAGAEIASGRMKPGISF